MTNSWRPTKHLEPKKVNRRGPARQSRNQSPKHYFTTEARSSQSSEYFLFKHLLLRVLRGHEKKFKNHQNCKFGVNEIEYLQLLIFAKMDYFSRPATPRCILFWIGTIRIATRKFVRAAKTFQDSSQSSQSSKYFPIKNSLLRALSASAVQSPSPAFTQKPFVCGFRPLSARTNFGSDA